MADISQVQVNGTTYDLKSIKLANRDTRNDNELPSYYMATFPKCITNEFKACATIGVSSLISSYYCDLITIVPWTDASGGRPIQIAISDSGVQAQRVATADATWGAWTTNTTVTYTLGTSGNNVTLTPSSGSAQSITVPYATSAGSASDNTKLPLSGGNMTGSSGIQFPTGSGSDKSGNWISAGGGFSSGSGKSGIKIAVCEQADTVMGFGADLGGGPYELSIVTGQNPNDASTANIKFLKHSVNSPTSYTQLGAFDGSGNFKANNNITADGVLATSQTSGTYGGISLYGGASHVVNYGIAFRTTSNMGKHGYVQGDWATYFTMEGATNRGWVYRYNNNSVVASISAGGNAVFNGSVTVGGNSTNTSGCRQVYNSTTQSLDFVFV